MVHLHYNPGTIVHNGPNLIGERRRCHRISFLHYIHCKSSNWSGVIKGLDICEHAISIRGRIHLRLGSVIEMEFCLPGSSEVITLQGVVFKSNKANMDQRWVIRFLNPIGHPQPLKAFFVRQQITGTT